MIRGTIALIGGLATAAASGCTLGILDAAIGTATCGAEGTLDPFSTVCASEGVCGSIDDEIYDEETGEFLGCEGEDISDGDDPCEEASDKFGSTEPDEGGENIDYVSATFDGTSISVIVGVIVGDDHSFPLTVSEAENAPSSIFEWATEEDDLTSLPNDDITAVYPCLDDACHGGQIQDHIQYEFEVTSSADDVAVIAVRAYDLDVRGTDVECGIDFDEGP